MRYNWLYFLLLTISVIFSMSMILFSFMRGKKNKTTYAFIFCHVIMIVWTLGQILENVSVNETQKWVATIIKYSGVVHTSGSWFIFTLLYTNRVKNLKKTFSIIFVLPLIFNLPY